MREVIHLAVEAARAAGRIQQERLDNIGEIQFKGEINLVTEVDFACEREIIRRIQERFPDHAILAEESGGTYGDAVSKWIIDPLDGTVNYAHGFPCYCVSIAFEHRGEVTAGVVYNPCLNELFIAEKGRGATLNDKKIRVSAIDNLKKSLLATGFSYDVAQTTGNDNLLHFGNFIKECQAVRRPGSACLDLCYTAMGRFEGYWELRVHPWDVAAGILLVREAGGQVTRMDGDPCTVYDRDFVASNGLVHDAMLAIVKRGASARP
jgi:myo-inositol-1(or 4)-monophosphatase